MAKKKYSDLPYPPSWQNRFFDAVDKLPVPNIVVFLGLFIGIAFFQHLIPWLEARLPWGKVVWEQFSFLIWPMLALIVFSYLINYSEKALGKFRAALSISDNDYKELKYRFLNLPAGSGWAITLVATSIIALAYRTPILQASYPAYLLSGFSGALIFLSSSIGLTLGFFLILFVLRQTREVGQLYAHVQKINLFNLAPLYALSMLTSRVGTIFIIVATLSVLSNSLFDAGSAPIAVNYFFGVINLGAALVLFILPLLGIHQRLVAKKEELLSETGERVRAAFERLNKEQAAGRMKEIGNTRQLVDAMIRQREYIQSVPTWPWNSGTLRTFLTALLVPLTVWIMQQVLLRTVAK